MINRTKKEFVPCCVSKIIIGLEKRELTQNDIFNGLIKVSDNLMPPQNSSMKWKEIMVCIEEENDFIRRRVDNELKPIYRHTPNLSTAIGLAGLKGFCKGRGRHINRKDTIEFLEVTNGED